MYGPATAQYPAALSGYTTSSQYGPPYYYDPGYAFASSRMLPTTTYGQTTPSSRFRDALLVQQAKMARNSNFSSSPSPSWDSSRSRSQRPMLRSSYTPMRSVIRDRLDDPSYGSRGIAGSSGSGSRFRSPSLAKERSRDELIDSIIHTRTREHRPMPGYRSSSNWEERRAMNIDADKVYPGIMLANGETVQNVDYLKRVGVTHVLNTAERHVQVNPDKFPLHDINYLGFHVDDHPSANIARYFSRSADFIDEALKQNGTVAVNCVMGWSRSATVVAAYLMAKKGMTATEALEAIRQHRPIRPNPGFLQQLASYENMIGRKLVW